MEPFLPVSCTEAVSSPKVVVITGAAGGLGSALSRRFAERGFSVFATDIHSSLVAPLIASVQEKGGRIRGCAADLASPSQTRAMIEKAIESYGHIDVLVNNAGVSGAKPIWEIEESDWDEVLNVNVKGTFFALQAAAKHMAGRGGSIVNIASVAGRVGRPTLLHYAASKAAVISITRSAAAALAKDKIRVNAIAPGMMDTDMLQGLQSFLAGNNGPGTPSVQNIPLGWVARPQEIVASVLFLASEDSSYMTGQTLNVDGGIVMS